MTLRAGSPGALQEVPVSVGCDERWWPSADVDAGAAWRNSLADPVREGQVGGGGRHWSPARHAGWTNL